MAQGVGSGAQAGVAGSLPGTERWMVFLRNPSFQRVQQMALIRAQTTPAGRRSQLASFRQLVLADQGAIAQVVVAAGGQVEQHFWMRDMLSVEIPPAALPGLRAHPRVARLVPVKVYQAGDIGASTMMNEGGVREPAPAPIGPSTDPLNHNVAAAWNILATNGIPYRGAGARVAVFDTGIDRDMNGGTAVDEPHPGLVDGNGVSRVEAHLQALNAQHVDVNTINWSPNPPYCGGSGPFGYRAPSFFGSTYPGHSEKAGHGTAMASIIAGNQYGSSIQAGHAPDGVLVDVAISSYPGSGAHAPWELTTSGMLSSIEALRAYLLEKADGTGYVHVINFSFSLDPDPFDPAVRALDSLAREEDILVVACANNTQDTTASSAGCYHAIAVGAVHTRSGVSPTNLAFVPLLQTARGPLHSDHRRYFPDVCATGAGVGSVVTSGSGTVREFRYPIGWTSQVATEACMLMPGIDLYDPSSAWPGQGNEVTPLRYRCGTSEAACQVSGAAALYRGYRASKGTPATAEESRAAILLNVVGTYTDSSGATSDPALQHAYTSRNTFGVGYVRDDLVAEFAKRDPVIHPLAQVVTLSPTTPTGQLTYTNLTPGDRYVAVACWRRYVTEEEVPEELELPNVDFEALDNGARIACSSTPANSYERFAFVAPPSGQVTLRAALLTTERGDAVPVQVVARRLAGDIDPGTAVSDVVHAGTGTVESASAGAGCTVPAKAWNVASILPTSYGNAYGSQPFSVEFGQGGGTWYKHKGFLGSGYGMNGMPVRHLQYCKNEPQLLPSTAHEITGLAFRTWRPLEVGGDLTLTIKIAETPPTASATGASLRWGFPPPNARRWDTITVTLRDPGPQGPEDFNVFSVLAPFPTPFAWGQGYTNAGDLHFWFESSGSPIFAVDMIDDGLHQWWPLGQLPANQAFGGMAMYWSSPNPFGREYINEDYGPIIGLVGPCSTVSREPLLEVLGSAWSGHGLHVRLSSSPPGLAAAVWVGDWSGVPVLFGPCGFLLGSNAQPVWLTTDAAGIAEFPMVVPTGVVHLQLGLQGVLLVPPTPSYVMSNGLRVTIGGAL